MDFAKRVQNIEPFRVVEVLTRAKALEAQGRDIVHMEAGEPDFATAQPILQAGRKALQEGATYYSQAQGLPELKEAIAAYYESDYGLTIDPSRILVTPGASGALQLIAMLLINEGDGVLMSDPGYPCNRNFIRLMGGQEQLVPVNPEDNFQLSSQLLQQHWQENTKAVLLATPSNPTGTLLADAELKSIVELTKAKGSTLIVDEIYHGLCYEQQPTSALSLSDDVFVVNSFSKYFGMTGWRLGWMVVPEYAVEPLNRLAQNLFISMSTMAQFAALEAFKPSTRELLDERKAIFASRRDFVVKACADIGLHVPCKPQGAFYVYAALDEAFNKTSEEFCMYALESHGVALTPGTDFGKHHCDDYFRMAYTTSMEQLEKGLERLAAMHKQIKK